jgi:hypothetical protein
VSGLGLFFASPDQHSYSMSLRTNDLRAIMHAGIASRLS